VVIVRAAITSPLVPVARSPPSSPVPLLPPAGEGEARLGGADRSDKSDRSDRSDKSDKSDRSVVGTETNHTVVARDCGPVRGDRLSCDYQSVSTRCAVTTLIPRPLAPASGRRGGALGGWSVATRRQTVGSCSYAGRVASYELGTCNCLPYGFVFLRTSPFDAPLLGNSVSCEC
jgi:hypothetical protein